MVLALCMVLGFIPVITLPAGASGTERTTTLDLTSAATSSNASECWSWNAETKTLTLSGVNIHIPDGADSSCGIELPNGSTITLADLSVNTVTAGNVTADSSRSSIGIRFKCTSGALNRVNGSGTLSVTGGEVQEENSTSFGIQTTDSGTLIIEGGTIHAYSSGAGWSSLALAVEKKLEISGGTVTARSGPAKYSFGISAGNDAISISGGTVEAVGGSATDYSCGMRALKNINISSGIVTATGGTVTGGSGISAGLNAFSNDVVISGGDVSATGISYGILAGGTCTLSGGTTITTPTDAGLSNDKKFIATALNGTTPVTAVHVMVPDVTAPAAPTAVTVTPIGGTVVTNVLNGTNTNMTATATIVAAAATGGKAELYVSGVLKCADNTILATDTQVTFDLGLSSTLGLQAAIATGGEVTVKLYDAAGNNTTSSVGNPTLTVDYSGSALIGTASVTGFTAPVIGAVPQAVGALTAGAASYTVTSLTWSPVHSPYAATTAYTATVVLTSTAGYKFPTAGIAAPTADGGGTVSAGVTSGGDVSGNQLTFTVLFPATSTASSSNAELTSVAGQSAAPSGGNGSTVGTPITWSINVANGVSTVSLSDIAAAANATKILYSDSGFSTPASIALTAGGALTAYIKVTAQDTTTVKYYAVTISRAAAPSGGTATPTPTVVIVNGQKQDAGTSSTATSGGQTVTTIKVDDTKLDKILEKSGDKPTVTLPDGTGSGSVVGELTGQTIKNMEKKEAVLEIRTDTVSYTLPAAQINIDSVSSQLGSQVALKDIKVSVKIAEPSAETVKVVQDTANKGNFQLVVKPVEFEISCTYGGKSVGVSKFNGYVERTVAIPDGVDPSKITTGIVLNTDGTFSHVPTSIVIIGGKYFARINSLTNSTYSVIYNPVEFADVATHWAKNAINDMGSRMVVTGVGSSSYEPDRSITRAEFSAVVVRALGLQKGTTESAFGDVSASDWFNGYVDTATAYSLITGYDSASYGPNDTITREQAMAIIARAMKLTNLSVSLTDSETASLLAKYTDGAAVSSYAKTSAAICLKSGVVTGSSETTLSPKAYVTRAEVAVMVQRLLQKSGLI